MSKIRFNEHQIRQIELNPNVTSLSDRTIQFTYDFKVRAVKKIRVEKGCSNLY
ncbi:hypothetical protein [Paenisporosarcina sp. TG-14]|uniref:hypothetical protein n=1 Tax=Paenisporosarcina sp. TG-14 TaxID=1231057 RepID=UPI0003698FD7